jgi:hypothetical protein
MNIETVRKLAASAPPPASKPWKFKDARTAWAEIERLESQIGIPHGPRIIQLGTANMRIAELEMILQKIKAAAPPPVVSKPAALQLPVVHADASAVALPPAQPLPAAKTVPEARRGQVARLECQRDRIASALPSLKGIDLDCGHQKIADLNAKIAKLTK